MERKRKSTRRMAEGKFRSGLYLFLPLLLGFILVLALIRYHAFSKVPITPPVYEEVYHGESDLSRRIGAVEGTIYEALYEGGVPANRIRFFRVQPRRVQADRWDFSELHVELPDRKAQDNIAEILTRALSLLEPEVSFEKRRNQKGGLLFLTFVGNYPTHEIRLLVDGKRKKEAKELPKIALIIDDLGYERVVATALVQMDLPLTLSFLPLAPHGRSLMEAAAKMGKEAMLHAPMERNDFSRAGLGPGALLSDMTKDEIRRTMKSDLEEIVDVRGVNNHMGSHFTKQADKMTAALKEIHRWKLYFVDSRTTPETIAFDLARKMGVPTAKRDVFLDNDLSDKAIRFQMERLVGIAEQSGHAIGIGHPHEETLTVLQDYLHTLKDRVEVVPVSHLVK
jgi:polysaccharide deacetylase 2 family uncharacterized protein YibQ